MKPRESVLWNRIVELNRLRVRRFCLPGKYFDLLNPVELNINPIEKSLLIKSMGCFR